MKNRCYTAYITGYKISFTAYSEDEAITDAKTWLRENNILNKENDIWVEETTDKFIDGEKI